MSTSSAGEKTSFETRHLIGAIAGTVCGHNEAIVQPVLVGLLVDERHLSQQAAGFVSTVEMIGFASGALACAALVRRVPWYSLVVFTLLAGAVANVACAADPSVAVLLALRFVPGFAAGLAISLATSAASRSPTAERTFGIIFASVLIYPVLLLHLLPYAIAEWGSAAFFLIAAVVQVAALALIRLMPPPRFASVAHAGPHLLRTAPATTIAILAATALLYAGHVAIWTYEERMGVALGVDRATVVHFLGSASAFGILGALLAAAQGNRIGQLWPQIISLGLSVAATAAIVFTRSYRTYQLAAIMIVLAWFYGAPYVNALAARLDPSGRLPALSGGMFALGLASGPLIGAALVGGGDYSRIGIVAACMYACCLALLVPVSIRLDRTVAVVST